MIYTKLLALIFVVLILVTYTMFGLTISETKPTVSPTGETTSNSTVPWIMFGIFALLSLIGMLMNLMSSGWKELIGLLITIVTPFLLQFLLVPRLPDNWKKTFGSVTSWASIIAAVLFTLLDYVTSGGSSSAEDDDE